MKSVTKYVQIKFKYKQKDLFKGIPSIVDLRRFSNLFGHYQEMDPDRSVFSVSSKII